MPGLLPRLARLARPVSRARVPFSAWVSLAALLHGVTWLSLHAERRLPASARPAHAENEELVELALLDAEDEANIAAEASAGGPRETRGAAQSPHGDSGSQRAFHSPPAPATIVEESGPGLPEAAGEASPAAPSADGTDGQSAGPRLSLEALGVGTSNQFVERAPGKSAAQGHEERLERSMQEAILSSDLSRNLTRSGPVVTAMRQATYGAALLGTADFVGTVDALGVVVALEPVNVSSDRVRWEELAKKTLLRLAKQRLRVPPGAKGLRVHLRVTSEEKLPSGHDPGLAVSALGIPIKKGAGKHSTRIDILKPNLGVDIVEVPVPGSDDPMRIPMLRAGIGVLGVGGDPADIGSTPRQVVHVRVLDEKPL